MPKRRKEDSDVESRVREIVRQGRIAILDGGDQRILVRNVKALSDSRYRGTIFGFSPSFVHQYRGLTVGESILFDADDVIDVT
jgi:hypothetical protein